MTESARRAFNMILSLLVAIGAWVFVVYNYDPMTLVKYSDVPVTFSGEDELVARGLAVDNASLNSVNVTLSQRRVDGGRIDKSNVRVVADVSECVAGSNKVTLKVSGPEATSVSSVSRSSIDVAVARTKTETRGIVVIYGEGAEEGAEPIAFDLSRTTAQVSCASERMKNVDRVAAVLNYADVTETVKSFTVDLVALDSEGNQLPHVVIYPEEISLDASAGFTKEVDLKLTVTDESDDNYERKYSAPSTVTIKGTQSAIEDITSISAEDINITYMYSDQEVDIVYDLPEGIYLADSSLDQKVKVTVREKTTEETTDSASGTTDE